MVDIVLASQSLTRARLLENAGLTISTVPARVDEAALRESLTAEGAPPRDQADALAEAKAQKVSARSGSQLVLGCDQILALGDRILGKSDTREQAAATLAELSGQSHQLFSAAVMYQNGAPVWRHVATARLSMRRLTRQDIDTYLDRCWPQAATSVGVYQIEGPGLRLFDRVEGSFFAILGLPLEQVLAFLIDRGDLTP